MHHAALTHSSLHEAGEALLGRRPGRAARSCVPPPPPPAAPGPGRHNAPAAPAAPARAPRPSPSGSASAAGGRRLLQDQGLSLDGLQLEPIASSVPDSVSNLNIAALQPLLPLLDPKVLDPKLLAEIAQILPLVSRGKPNPLLRGTPLAPAPTVGHPPNSPRPLATRDLVQGLGVRCRFRTA
jgi:hypothetical protein